MAGATVEIEPITGRYARMEIHGRPHRLYFEEAGAGIPLLCLHTAGADGRQFRAMLNDAEITSRFRVIAFDMPWHGKSSPPEGFQDEEYRLTTDGYVELVVTVARALELDRPVVMGCSIGGRVVLELAKRHPDAVPRRHRAAVLGLRAALFPARLPAQAERPRRRDVRRLLLRAGRAAARRRRTAGRRSGTTCRAARASSRATCTSTRSTATSRTGWPRSTPARCPVFMLTGEYDYSCTPEASRETAALIPGAELTIMPGLGPFPDERGPGAVQRVPAAGAGADFRSGLTS